MNTGFFKEYLDNEDFEGFGFLENYDIAEDYISEETKNTFSRSRLNADFFLHGRCFDFAMKLAEKHKYKIEIIDIRKGRKKADSGIIHAYCTKVIDNIKYYIDIRGITTDPELFFEEFENEIWYAGGDVVVYEDYHNPKFYAKITQYSTPKFYFARYPKDKIEYAKEATYFLDLYSSYYDLSKAI